MTEAVRLTIRPGRAFDARDCARIVNAWVDDTPWFTRTRSEAEVAQRYAHRFAGERTVLIAEVSREVAGFLALDEATAEVTSFYVDQRGRGIGAALMNAAKQGRDRLMLWTFAANAGARRFYLREGFVETGRSEGDNDEGLPDVQYTWVPA